MAASRKTKIITLTALLLSLAVIASVTLPATALIPFPRPRSSIWDLFEDDPFRSILDQSDPFSISLPLPKSIANPTTTDSDSQLALIARADWKETPTSHVITIDVPGIKKEDLKIEMEEESRVLRVSGERKVEKEEGKEDDKWHRVERTCGKFWRQFRMPRDADMEKVKVGLADGVLKITVPKVAPIEEKKKGAKVISIDDESEKKVDGNKMLKDEM